MAKETKVQWAKSSFNGWIGCTYHSSKDRSEACRFCYANAWAKRTGRDFSVPKLTTTAYWKKPLKWNEEAGQTKEPWRVFAFSLGDVFDLAVDDAWREAFFNLVCKTPNLTWMVLTKQAEKMYIYYHEHFGGDHIQNNLWFGVTVENQEQAINRIPWLLKTPAYIHFISGEPLLEDINIMPYLPEENGYIENPPHSDPIKCPVWWNGCLCSIDWVICGAETGAGARYMNPEWARSLRDQSQAAEVPFFMKQMSGKEPIPDDLMIREFPV